MAVNFTSYDDVYKSYAWRDNHHRLVVTQGEGLSSDTVNSSTYVKTAKFQLRDERGVISLPNSTTAVTLALKKRDGSEALVSAFYDYSDSSTVKSNDRTNGIVYFAIKQSMTDVPGDVTGEIRLTTSTGVIKFYGINFYVYDGVSNNAAVQSNPFDLLNAALAKVEALTETADSSGNLITLDDAATLIAGGGTHPSTSQVIYNFVNGNYRQISYAHEAYAASYDKGVYIDSATDIMKMYYLLNSNDARIGIILCAFPPGYSYGMQLKIHYNGNISIRVKTKESGESDYTWKDWTAVGTTQNIQDLAVTTAKLANGAVTSAKIGTGEVKTGNIDGNAVTTPKIADSNVTPEKLDRSYTEFKEISSSALDSATTNGIIYKVSLDGRTNYLFCVNSGSNLRTQYRFDTLGFAKYRVYQNSAWSDWTAVGTTQNIQDLAVTTAKLANGAVTVSKLDIDDPDTLVQLLEGKAIYYHKTSNQAPVETMYVKYPIPTLWCTGSKYYMLSGRTNGSSSGSYNYTINKLPSDATIAGLSLHSSITSAQLKETLGYCEVKQRTRIPTNADIGVVGDKWVAQLTDSNNHVYYEIYELQRYYTEDNAPTVTLYGWEKMIYFSETNRVTVWDAATSATNNYIVPTSQVGKTGDIIIVSPASGTGGEVWQLTKVVSAYGTKTYIWEKQVFANALTNYMKKAYSVSPSDIADVPAGQLFLCTGSIALKTGSTASDYIELVKMATLNSTITTLTNQLRVVTFSYTLTLNDWNNNQQSITVPSGYVVTGDVIADAEIDSAAFTQLCQDGCTGIYISSVTSNNVLTLTAHAMGNTPTAAVTIQVTLTPVTDLDE